MPLVDAALIVSIISTGLFAGLMMTLVVIMQRMWAALPVTTYMEAMQSFLPAAKGNLFVTIIMFLPIFAPVGVLVGLRNESESSQFLLTLVGLILACGPFLVTLRLNFPIYDAMMHWQPTNPPHNWQQTRTRFFVLNLLRFILALGAMLCFLLALIA
jgi:uncharacterized membrane protein